MWVRGIALAGMGQWCGWRARADLWSAGIPAGMGGVVGPGSAGALAGMGQWCGWRASADLWSAGIPAGMGGVVGSRDVGGDFMGEAPHPLRVPPTATGYGSASAPTRRRSFHAMTMGRRGRRRSRGGVPPFPVNPLIGGPAPICGPRASQPAWGAARAPALPGWYAAFPRQSTVWWAGADLWSAGVPPRMGGVVRICDMDGAFVGENPHPLRVAPIATGEGSDAVPTRRSSFHVMTMGRRGRRRSQDDAPPIPINPLIGGQVPICGPRASLPAWAG